MLEIFRAKPDHIVMTDNSIIRLERITGLDLCEFEKYGHIWIWGGDISQSIVSGFKAQELIWLMKPGYLEGLSKIKYHKYAWAIHNLIAHPLLQLLAFVGLTKWGMWIHDQTVPKPKDG